MVVQELSSSHQGPLHVVAIRRTRRVLPRPATHSETGRAVLVSVTGYTKQVSEPRVQYNKPSFQSAQQDVCEAAKTDHVKKQRLPEKNAYSQGPEREHPHRQLEQRRGFLALGAVLR